MKIELLLVEKHRAALGRAATGFVTFDDKALLADIAGAVNLQFDHVPAAPPVPPSEGSIYEPRELAPDDWCYYVQTPAVEWRVQGPGKAEGIRDYQHGGSQYGYYLDNRLRVRDTYNGILVRP